MILKNTTFIDSKNFEFKKTHIRISEKEKKVEFLSELPANIEKEEIIDCSNKYVSQSFACGHHHVYSALAKGMPAPKKQPANFYEILQYIWWTLDKCLDKEMIEASALATAIECAKNGCTFVIDHHSSPNCIEGSLSIIAQAFEKVGVSHLLCYEITDRNGLVGAEKGLIETENYLQTSQALVGLHASFTVGNDTLQKAVELALKYKSGIHIHVAEDKFDQTFTMREYKKTVIQRLKDFGALDFSKTILGHCIHLSNNEKDILRNSKAWIVQNMDSNLNNQVGYFNSEWLGDRIMLGTDGMHSDMIKSAKSAYFAGKSFDKMEFQTPYLRFRKVHDYIKQNSFTGDSDANLIVFDYQTATAFNQNNFLGHFLFGFESAQIVHVISDGKMIVKDKKLCNVDENEIFNFTKEQSIRLWEKFKTM